MNSLKNLLSCMKNQGLLPRDRSLNYVLPVTILFFSAVLLSGCISYYNDSPPAADYYFINPNKSLSTVGRVVVVGLNNNSNYPEISKDVTEKLYQALQKKQVFGLTVVRQDDPLWRSTQLGLDSRYTLEEIINLRETLQCDAVLLGTITEFRPFPHMIIGLRLRLLDLRDGDLLWALEQVWDSADKITEYRIKDYFQAHKRSGYAPLQEQLTSVSSLEYIKFVSYEVAETL